LGFVSWRFLGVVESILIPKEETGNSFGILRNSKLHTDNEKYIFFVQDNRGEDFWKGIWGFCFMEISRGCRIYLENYEDFGCMFYYNYIDSNLVFYI